MRRANIVADYWKAIDSREFRRLKDLFAEGARIVLANTDEIFRDLDRFISFNEDYPGPWRASVVEVGWAGEKAVSITKVWNPEDGQGYFVTSVFELERGLIRAMTEYWSENGRRPAWRDDDRYTRIIKS